MKYQENCRIKLVYEKSVKNQNTYFMKYASIIKKLSLSIAISTYCVFLRKVCAFHIKRISELFRVVLVEIRLMKRRMKTYLRQFTNEMKKFSFCWYIDGLCWCVKKELELGTKEALFFYDHVSHVSFRVFSDWRRLV